MSSLIPLPAWTALVVEDEPRLRAAMVDHLRAASFAWRDILQARDAEEALAICRLQRPEVAFLDIRLPGISGLELAEQLPAGIHIVFVTAYDAYAIAAFEAGAIDYLLKPATPERIQKTLDRIRYRSPGPVENLRQCLEEVRSAKTEPLRWITASLGRRTHLVPVEEILFFQADSKYTRVECRDASYVITQPIKELAARLSLEAFQQVHRSTIVNLRAVAWVEKQDGSGVVHLREHEAKLSVSATYLKALLGRR